LQAGADKKNGIFKACSGGAEKRKPPRCPQAPCPEGNPNI
jgi:hypothetical protein